MRSRIDPPLWVSSIFGLPWTWLPPFDRYSEFRIIDLWQPLHTLKYLRDVSLPAISRNPPEISAAPVRHVLLSADGDPAASRSVWLLSVVSA